MPRKSRINAPGALHHITFRGLKQRNNINGYRAVTEKIASQWQDVSHVLPLFFQNRITGPSKSPRGPLCPDGGWHRPEAVAKHVGQVLNEVSGLI